MLSNVIGQNPFGNGMMERYGDTLVPQGLSAEMIAARWGITREEADGIALQSHRRAAAAAAVAAATMTPRRASASPALAASAGGVVNQSNASLTTILVLTAWPAGAQVTGITISQAQHDFASRRI